MSDSRIFNLELDSCNNLDKNIVDTMALCLHTTSELIDANKRKPKHSRRKIDTLNHTSIMSNDLSRDDVSGLQETMLELAKTSSEIKLFNKNVVKLKQILNQGQPDEDHLEETLTGLSNGVPADIDKQIIEGNHQYQKLVTMIDNAFSVENPEDSETVVDEEMTCRSEANIPTDPMTKQEVKDPVKNVHCGHIYDRDSIIPYMKHKKLVKCPCVGCTNKVPLVEKDLVDDWDTRKLIQRKRT